MRSNKISLGIEIVTSSVSISDMLVKFDLISEESSDATESLDELESFLRFVSNELNFNTETSVVITEPLCKGVLLEDIVVLPTLLVLEEFSVLFLSRVQ